LTAKDFGGLTLLRSQSIKNSYARVGLPSGSFVGGDVVRAGDATDESVD